MHKKLESAQKSRDHPVWCVAGNWKQPQVLMRAWSGLAGCSGRRLVCGLQLLFDDVDFAFTAGDSFDDAHRQLVELGYFVGKVVEAIVLGVEALVDVLVLGIETGVYIGSQVVEALVHGVEALVDGVDNGKFGAAAEYDENTQKGADGGYVVFEPVPRVLHRSSGGLEVSVL